MDIFKKVLKVLTITSGIVLAGLIIISRGLDKEIESINNSIRYETAVAEEVREPAQPVGVLLLGVDSREGSFGDSTESVTDSRSDAILYASVNPETGVTELLTIPRDTLVEMEEMGGKLDKINHSYANGGVDSTIKTVSNYLDVPIHYYVEMNMNGLVDLVDAVGGVSITPALSFSYGGHSFEEGVTRTLTGEEALTYARMRKDDPKGDVGRGERQQEVIQAIIDSVVSLDLLNTYEEVLTVLKGNMRTNATVSLGLLKDYMPATQTINKISAETHYDYTINGVYYLGLLEEDRIEFSNRLRTNLGLTPTESDKGFIHTQANQGVLTGIGHMLELYEEKEEVTSEYDSEYKYNQPSESGTSYESNVNEYDFSDYDFSEHNTDVDNTNEVFTDIQTGQRYIMGTDGLELEGEE